MNRVNKLILLIAFVFAGSVNAAIIDDFSGVYEAGNWTQSLSGGAIDTSGAPDTISLISSDDGYGRDYTDFTIAAADESLISFDWSYTTDDVDGSFFDPFGLLLNGNFFQLTTNWLHGAQSGSVSFEVSAGDVFGFRSIAVDSIFGSSTAIVSNFSAVTVPEPASIALIALGLLGLMISRRRKSA